MPLDELTTVQLIQLACADHHAEEEVACPVLMARQYDPNQFSDELLMRLACCRHHKEGQAACVALMKKALRQLMERHFQRLVVCADHALRRSVGDFDRRMDFAVDGVQTVFDRIRSCACCQPDQAHGVNINIGACLCQEARFRAVDELRKWLREQERLVPYPDGGVPDPHPEAEEEPIADEQQNNKLEESEGENEKKETDEKLRQIVNRESQFTKKLLNCFSRLSGLEKEIVQRKDGNNQSVEQIATELRDKLLTDDLRAASAKITEQELMQRIANLVYQLRVRAWAKFDACFGDPCLEILDEQTKTVYFLVEGQEVTVRDIAEQIGISHDEAKKVRNKVGTSVALCVIAKQLGISVQETERTYNRACKQLMKCHKVLRKLLMGIGGGK